MQPYRLAVSACLEPARRGCNLRLSARLSLLDFCQVGLENFVFDALAQESIFYRINNFDSFVEIAGHPIGAAEVDLLLASVGKTENTAVLEETSHDASHCNVVAHTANSRPQRAHATNDQINLDSRL